MNIALIGEPWLLPPRYYGGADRMLHLLGRGLEKRGHRVHLMAGKGSDGYGGRVVHYKNQTKNLLSRTYRRVSFSIKSLCLSRDVDIVHSFKFWPGCHSLVNFAGKPIIYRQDNASSPADLCSVIKSNPKNGYMQAVSCSQIRDLVIPDPGKCFVVYNAVDTSIIKPVVRPSRDYLAYLGRLNYDKGIDIAVQLSLQSGIPLKIAGVVRPDEHDAHALFEESVKPYLGEQIQFVGAINDLQKSDFLGNALALLMPNRWSEPFGIVIAEALAAGTLVIGTNTGSIPELIIHQKSGFVCNSFDELLESIRNAGVIRPKDCRNEALQKYSEQTYIRSILRMYEKVLSR